MAKFQPWGYATQTYLNLKVTLKDSAEATVKIDRYLNAGITNRPDYPRANNAHAEKDALFNAVARELKSKSPYPPPQFTVEDQTFARGDIQRVFGGKGSPTCVANVVWLAARYGRTDAAKVQTYCDKFTGLDCNGFAGNYWGVDPTTEISGYDANRRKEPEDVDAGDALIFYTEGVAKPYHIALVDDVDVDGGKLALTIVQSAGPDQGLERLDLGKLHVYRNGKGEIYCKPGFVPAKLAGPVYVAAGPAKKPPAF